VITNMQNRLAKKEEGFTLVELLVVIVILGILAAIVVFAVGGITDKGEKSACSTDKRTLETAEEANFAVKGAYATEANLVTNGFLKAQSAKYDVASVTAPVAANPTATPPEVGSPGSYTLAVQSGSTCTL
jgi:prepilin-type N-terminal cleavage/methylation domain-containing protein